MKKQTILKVLSFVVLLTLVLSAVLLSGCNEEIKADIETTKTELEAAQAALKKAEDAIEALKTAAAKLDEDSATKAALTDKAAELQAAIDANAKTLKELKDTLVELGNSGATKDALAALETRVKALEDDLAAKATTITTLTEGLAAANKKIDDDKTELANAIAEAKAEVEGTINKLDDTYATDAELEAAIKVLEANLTKALNDAIDAVKADYATTQKLNDEIAKINTSITALDTAIKALGDTYATDDELAAAVAKLETAIGLISGEGIDANGLSNAIDFSENYQSFTEYLAKDENDYSFYKFIKKVNEFDSSDPTEYMYHATALELELARTTSVEEAKAVFAKLDKLQDDYKSYLGQLKAAIAALKEDGITRDTDLTKLDELRTEAQKDPAYNSEENKSVEADYQAILAARQRLNDAYAAAIAAADKAVELGLLAKDDDGVYTIVEDAILYKAEVEANIGTVKGLYKTIEETYFKDADMTALYKDKTMGDLPGYKLFNEQADKYKALQDARAALNDVELTTLPTVTVNPLFSQLGSNEEGKESGILGDIAAIEKWAEDNKIAKNSENFTLIVNDFLKDLNENVELSVAKVEELRAYAAAMTGIYTDEVKALKDQIEKVIKDGATDVRWTDVEWPDAETPGVLDTMFNAIDALKGDVAKVPGYTAADGNVNAMLNLNDAGWATLADIQARMELLNAAKKAVDVLYDKFDKKVGNVTLGDTEITEQWGKDIDNIFNVTFADADDAKKDLAFDAAKPDSTNYVNYLEMTKDVKDKLAALISEYMSLTSDVQAAYEAVKDIVNKEDDKLNLTDLQKILWANKRAAKITVDTPDFNLIDPELPGGVISFKEFYKKLTAKVLKLVALAEAAEQDATDNVTEKLAALGKYNLNKTADFEAVLADVMKWIKDYLGITIEGDTLQAKLNDLMAKEETLKGIFAKTESVDEYGKLNGEDSKILGIGNKNFPKNGDYKFIEDIEAVIGVAKTMKAKLDEAKGVWDGIVADYEELLKIEEIHIHDDAITDVYNAYNTYVATYYAGAIVEKCDQFDELKLFNGTDEKVGLKDLKDELDSKKAAAEALYGTIMAQAAALNDVDIPKNEDVDDILAAVKALEDNMKAYKAYCDGGETCDGGIQCKFIAEDGMHAELVALKAKAKALIVKVFADNSNKPKIEWADKDYVISNDNNDKLTFQGIFCRDRIDSRDYDAEDPEVDPIKAVKDDYNLFLDIALKSAEEGVDRADYALEVVAES